jgi:hypothetical protein
MSFSRVWVPGCIVLFGASAQADVKIVSHVNGTSMGRTQPQKSITTWYKSDLMRIDTPDMTTIFDAKSGKAITIDHKRKLYSEVADAVNPMTGVKVDATATVSPTTEVLVIAGKNAHKNLVDLNVTMNMDGGFSPKINVHMDLWTTEDLKTAYSPAHLMRVFAPMLKNVLDPAKVQELSAELSKIKGFPLNNKMTVNSGQSSGPMMELETVVDSISEDPLGDDIFQIPADYKKSEKPIRRMPPPGGGGG